MNQENYDSAFRVLELAQKVADQGPLMVDSWQVTERKRIFSLLVEAFRSFSAFSRLLRMHFYVQSCPVLRLFVEQVSKFLLLVRNKDLYDVYVHHLQVREQILEMSQKERKKTVINEFGLSENQYSSALSFLDYGWARSLNKEGKYGYHEMLKLAWEDNETILKWIDKLDQFIHQNLDSNSITEEGFLIFEVDNIYLGTVVFERLFVELLNRLEKLIPPGLKTSFTKEFWPAFEKFLNQNKAQA